MKALVVAALVFAETHGVLLICSCATCRRAARKAGRLAFRGGPNKAGL